MKEESLQEILQRILTRSVVEGEKNPVVFQDLSNKDLTYQDFNYVDLAGCKLVKTRFNYSNLYGASFMHADLRMANFRDAELLKADFSGADLRGAKFSNNFRYAIYNEETLVFGRDLDEQKKLLKLYFYFYNNRIANSFLSNKFFIGCCTELLFFLFKPDYRAIKEITDIYPNTADAKKWLFIFSCIEKHPGSDSAYTLKRVNLEIENNEETSPMLI